MNLRHYNISPKMIEAADQRLESFAEQMGQFWRRNLLWILLAGLGLLVLQDVFGVHGVLAMRRAQHEATREQQEIDRMNQENAKLQNRVNQLKTDPQAIERIAREQMGLARPGEYIFKVSPPNQSGSGGSSSAHPSRPDTPAKTN
ncbi:MAG: septum formation initiator family protein [Acidobacteriota bacterium]|nr:septum formation initiator family protein [Acidobacteriota bacterium]